MSKEYELDFFKIKVLHKDAKLLYNNKVNMGIPLASSCVILGPRGSGKSTLLKSLCYVFQRVPRFIVVSLTEDGNNFFSQFVPKSFIYSSYTPEILETIIETQDKFIEKYGKDDPRTQMVLVLDDCLADKKIWKSENLIKIMLNGRHKNITFIFTLQSTNGHTIPQEVRDNIDFLFILSLPSMSVKDKVFKDYTDCFKNKNEFREILDICTRDFGCLLLNKKIKSDKLIHKAFYYKSEQNLPPFKVGHPSIWNFDRMNVERKPRKIEKKGGTTIKLY